MALDTSDQLVTSFPIFLKNNAKPCVVEFHISTDYDREWQAPLLFMLLSFGFHRLLYSFIFNFSSFTLLSYLDSFKYFHIGSCQWGLLWLYKLLLISLAFLETINILKTIIVWMSILKVFILFFNYFFLFKVFKCINSSSLSFNNVL